jgi:large subunit ribosomal protein L5
MTERRSRREAVAGEPMVAADELTATEAVPEVTGEVAPEMPGEDAVAPQETAEDATAAAMTEVVPDVEAAPDAEAADAADAEAADAAATGATPETEAATEPAAADATEDAGDRVAAAVAEPPTAPARERRPKGRTRDAELEGPAPPPGPRGLRLRYDNDVIPALRKQFEYANPNQVPRLEKIVVNIGLGEALTNAKAIDAASSDLTMITGQKPIVMKARRSIAQFKIRTGNPIGLKVTLRGQRMWDFLERMTMLALPRIRDFRGTPGRSFDGRGNYTLGLREQIAFPEIDYDKVDRLRGLEVSIVTTAKSDEESKRLLELLGMPFAS